MFWTLPTIIRQTAKILMARYGEKRHNSNRTLSLLEFEPRINPTDYVVNSYGDNPIATDTLRYAIDNAVSGDTIKFNSTKFSSSGSPEIQLTDDLPTIDDNITITGPSDNSFVKINADGYTVFNTATSRTVTMSGLSIRNTPGGLDLTGGTFTLNNVRLFKDTGGGSGAAIRTTGTDLTLNDCELTGNSVSGDGGAISADGGSVTINDTTISGNTAGG